MDNIAKGIRANKPQSYLATIKYFGFLSSLSDLGTRFELNILKNFIDIDLHVSGEDIIPKFVLSQTKIGNYRSAVVMLWSVVMADHLQM